MKKRILKLQFGYMKLLKHLIDRLCEVPCDDQIDIKVQQKFFKVKLALKSIRKPGEYILKVTKRRY